MCENIIIKIKKSNNFPMSLMGHHTSDIIAYRVKYYFVLYEVIIY